jgi:hypothetical protein
MGQKERDLLFVLRDVYMCVHTQITYSPNILTGCSKVPLRDREATIALKRRAPSKCNLSPFSRHKCEISRIAARLYTAPPPLLVVFSRHTRLVCNKQAM